MKQLVHIIDQLIQAISKIHIIIYLVHQIKLKVGNNLKAL